MRNLDSCRCWRCTLCPCKVRNTFRVNFWNRTIILCIPCTCYTGHPFKTLLCIFSCVSLKTLLPHADFEGRNLSNPLTCTTSRKYRVPHNERLSIHGAVGWRRVTWAPALRSYIPRLACKCGTFPLVATLFCREGYRLLYSNINLDTKKDDVRCMYIVSWLRLDEGDMF